MESNQREMLILWPIPCMFKAKCCTISQLTTISGGISSNFAQHHPSEHWFHLQLSIDWTFTSNCSADALFFNCFAKRNSVPLFPRSKTVQKHCSRCNILLREHQVSISDGACRVEEALSEHKCTRSGLFRIQTSCFVIVS